jgi:hypothetical protein
LESVVLALLEFVLLCVGLCADLHLGVFPTIGARGDIKSKLSSEGGGEVTRCREGNREGGDTNSSSGVFLAPLAPVK